MTTVGGRLLPKVPLSSSSSSSLGRDDDARPSTSGLKTTTTQKRRLSSSRCCCCCCCSCASSSTLVTDAMTSSSFVSSVKMSSSSSSTTTTTRGARGRTMATRVAFGWSPLRSKRASWKKKQSSTTLSKTKTCVPRAKESKDSFQMKEKFSNETKLRSEAQAPFRVARQFLYASCALSATIGFGIATIQLITGLAGAPNAPPFDQSVSNVVCANSASPAAFAFLWKKDEEAKEKQMSRIGREERLGGLKVELTTGKIVRMQSLRGFSRVVLFAGNLEYLENSLEVAERYKDELIKKGVFLVPVPMDDDAATKLNKPDNAKKNERRFRGSAVNVSQKDGWRDWIWEQKKMAKLGDDVGVYVGLRMDGECERVGKAWHRSIDLRRSYHQSMVDGEA